MVSEGTQKMTAATPDQAGHVTFFRQSGWLMIANIAGGAVMWGVHFLARWLKDGEYGTFGALLAIVAVLPAMPLQMVFAQQTAKALATGRERELAGMIRLVLAGTFGIWLAAALLVFVQQEYILRLLQINDALGLWIMVVSCLLGLWMPIFFGVLQGQQNFFWLGWSMMLHGVGRLGIAAVAVFAVGGYAAGMLSGLLFGLIVGTAIAVWQTAGLWRRATAPFDWRSLLAQVLPLMLGFGAFQFLFLADTMFVKSYFTKTETDAYVAAGTLSRALMWLVGPLAAVMFPRIVHSAAKSEKTDLMRTVLLGTLILAVLGVLGLWLVGPFAVRIIYPATYADQTIALLLWYAAAMVPLALANVLLNNLMARGAFRVVPVLLVLVIGFVFALSRWHDSLVTVVKVLGTFNLLLLAVSAWFTYRAPVVAVTANTN
jgi:O-antigen/teichoic acid export membrane protein